MQALRAQTDGQLPSTHPSPFFERIVFALPRRDAASAAFHSIFKGAEVVKQVAEVAPARSTPGRTKHEATAREHSDAMQAAKWEVLSMMQDNAVMDTALQSALKDLGLSRDDFVGVTDVTQRCTALTKALRQAVWLALRRRLGDDPTSLCSRFAYAALLPRQCGTIPPSPYVSPTTTLNSLRKRVKSAVQATVTAFVSACTPSVSASATTNTPPSPSQPPFPPPPLGKQVSFWFGPGASTRSTIEVRPPTPVTPSMLAPPTSAVSASAAATSETMRAGTDSQQKSSSKSKFPLALSKSLLAAGFVSQNPCSWTCPGAGITVAHDPQRGGVDVDVSGVDDATVSAFATLALQSPSEFGPRLVEWVHVQRQTKVSRW